MLKNVVAACMDWPRADTMVLLCLSVITAVFSDEYDVINGYEVFLYAFTKKPNQLIFTKLFHN